MIEQRVEVDGGWLHTETYGTGAPLLLVHGGPGADGGYFRPLAQQLAADFCVHFYDQRCCGKSTGKVEALSFEQTVNDLNRLREHWRHKTWTVLGHSWGAKVAIGYALRYPLNVRGMILIGRSSGGPEYRARRRAKWTDEEAQSYESSNARLKSETDPVVRAQLGAVVTQLTLQADMADYRRDHVLPVCDGPGRHDVNAILNASTKAWFEQIAWPKPASTITAPVLILHGDSDPGPADENRELSKLLPRGKLEIIPNSGHFPWIEQRDFVGTQLAAFLNRINDTTR